VDGKDGTNGTDGVDGKDGKDGVDGKDGAPGGGMPPMLQPGEHMGQTSDGKSVKLKDWDSAGDSHVTFWKSGGDIQLNDFAKQADGSWAATEGREWTSNGWKDLTDQNGDGFVFQVGTENADGSYDFWADTSSSKTLDGKFY
ncbi:MAG: Unknown protein, partial [uncultured Thiotrichaceae bacterium]